MLATIVSVDPFPDTAAPGRSTAFLVLTAFLVTFLFIRTSARLIRNPNVTWWPGNVEAGGVHIHHLVWGISLLLVSGFLAFVADLEAPWWQLTAVGFGVGAGLTLDEFALWLHLEDVYWAEEGRRSVDAVVIATPVATHGPVGLAALGAGKYVLVEKPLAMTIAEGEDSSMRPPSGAGR